MKIKALRHASLGWAITIFLAACAGRPIPAGVPSAAQRLVAGITQNDRNRSSTLTDVTEGDLLYVVNPSTVTMYSYPNARVVGTLDGFYFPGICAGNGGDIFITNYPPGRISKYAHGGRKPIEELKPSKYVGLGSCAVDPTTGDLAVTGSLPRVDVFRNARGKPRLYIGSHFFMIAGCTYDDAGNLFVGGLSKHQDGHGRHKPMYAELHKGTNSFVNVTLQGVVNPDFIFQWHGKYLALQGYLPTKGSQYAPVIYQVAIRGTTGVKVGTTILGTPASNAHQFAILGGTVVFPNWYYLKGTEKFNVLFYDYPSGGPPTKILVPHFSNPYGAAISVARR